MSNLSSLLKYTGKQNDAVTNSEDTTSTKSSGLASLLKYTGNGGNSSSPSSSENASSSSSSGLSSLLKYTGNNASTEETGVSTATTTNTDTDSETQNNGGVLGGIGYTLEKVGLGALSSVEGIWDYVAGGLAKLFGQDDWAEQQFANDWVDYNHADNWYNPSSFWQTAGDVGGGIGTSLVNIAAVAGVSAFSGGTLTPLAAGAVSGLTAGLGAAGNATKEAYQTTGELGGKEFAYGAISGATEAGVEGLSSVLGAGTGAVVKRLSTSLGKDVTKTVARESIGKAMLKGFAGEAFEEGLQAILEPVYKRMTYDETAENATLKEVAYSALVGGLSGAIMSGSDVSIRSAGNLIKGNKIVNENKANGIIELAENISEYENANKTEDESFQAVQSALNELKTSLEKTNGEIKTAKQKMLVGYLQNANTAAVFSPMVSQSAQNIVANAEVIAEKYKGYGVTDSNGNKIEITAEQIRSGLENGWKSALKTNDVLRTLAVNDVTGKLIMNNQSFVESTLSGQALSSQVDLNRFIETATDAELDEVGSALGIQNWQTLTNDELRNRIIVYAQNGGIEAQKNISAIKKQAQSISAENVKDKVPYTVPSGLADGITRYSSDGMNIAIIKDGKNYRLYDYETGRLSKVMTRKELSNTLVNIRKERNALKEQAQAEIKQTQERAEKQARFAKETAEIDSLLRENVKEYSKLSAGNQSMIRSVIRQARANGISETDALSYARVSAHSGINIVFSKELNLVGTQNGIPVYADGFYDAKKNRIVVNPETKRTHEAVLIHELTHAIYTRSEFDANGNLTNFEINVEEEVQNMSEEEKKKIQNKYKKVGKGGALEVSDEINAHYAEDILTNQNILERLTKEKPSLKQRILDFFSGAKNDYGKEDIKLSKSAERLYKNYKKMFDLFTEENAGKNQNIVDNSFSVKTKEEYLNQAENSESQEKRYALPDTDSQGKKLSESQIEFFKDSKVVDENGKLKVVYHGTQADFNVFDNSKGMKSIVEGGLYFTTNEKDAKAYSRGGKVLEAYLNITGYLDMTNIDREYVLGVFDFIPEEQIKLAKEENINLQSGSLAFADLANAVSHKWGRYKDATEVFKGWGFDGVKQDNETYVAFDSNQIKLTTNIAPSMSEDIRYALPKNEEAWNNIEKSVLKEYGKTRSWRNTGYILTDGTQVDMSMGSGRRIVDHRDIFSSVEEDGSEALVKFMSRGNIRVLPESAGINLQIKPTQAQYVKISEYIDQIGVKEGYFYVDFDNKSGDTIDNIEYENNINSKRIISDIEYYFKNGKVPEVSELSRFRYALPDIDSDGNKLSNKQIRYFRNSKAVNNDGKLVVVYHGSSNAGFTEFKNKIAYYTSDNPQVAKGYNQLSRNDQNLYKGYLNIKNPLVIDAKERQWYKMFKMPINKQLNLTNKQLSNVLEKSFGIDIPVKYTPADLVYIVSTINKLGYGNYDGIIIKNIYDNINETHHYLGNDYIFFNSNQFKNITNQNPTENNDIRYALDDDISIDDVDPLYDDYDENEYKAEATKNIDQNKEQNAQNDVKKAQIVKNNGKMVENTAKVELSRGQTAKVVANNTGDKVYTKQEARAVIDKIFENNLNIETNALYEGVMENKNMKSLEEALWIKLNTVEEGYRSNVALETADYILNNVVFEDVLAQDNIQPQVEILDVMKDYFNTINFTDENKQKGGSRIYDSTGKQRKNSWAYEFDDFKSIRARWGTKGTKGVDPSSVAGEINKRLGYNLINYEGPSASAGDGAINEYDIMHQIVDAYNDAYDEYKKATKKRLLKDVVGENNSESYNELRQNIARDILNAYDEFGAKSKKAKQTEKWQNKIKEFKSKIKELQKEARELKKRNKLENYITSTAKYLKDIGNGKAYVGSETLKSYELTAWLKEAGKLEYRNNLRQSGAREIVSQLGKFYNKENALLYDNDERLNYIDQNVVDAIEFIKQNQTSDAELSYEELRAVDVILKGIKHLYQTFDQMILDGRKVTVTETATEAIRISKDAPRHTGKGFFNWVFKTGSKIVEPRTVIKALDGFNPHGINQRLYNEITNGETKANLTYMTLMSDFDEFLKTNKKYDKRLAEQRLDFMGHEITIGEALTLYELSKREQAKAGLYESGIAYFDEKGVKQTITGFTESDIKNMAKQFTETDKKLIKITEKFFNEKASKIKRNADAEILGYTNALEEFYFPIKRDDSTIARNITDGSEIMSDFASVYAFSFNKDVREGAKNKLFVRNVYDIISRHAKQLSIYANLTIPLKNYAQVYAKNIGTKTDIVSLKETLNTRVWDGTEDYLKKLFTDIQGSKRKNGILEKIRSAYAKYQLGANLKVIVSQVTSYPTAGIYLDGDILAKGFVMKTDYAQMDKYSPYAAARNYEKGIVKAESVSDKVSKVGDYLTKPIQWTDRLTIGRLWNACQLQVEKDYGYKIGTEENLKQAGILHEEVIRNTQPNYSNTERSELMRSDSDFWRSFTMFTSVPLKQLSRLVDSAYTLKSLSKMIKEGNSDPEILSAYKAAKKQAGRTVASIVIANLMYSLVAEGFKWLYNNQDEDDDGNKVSFLKSLATDFSSTTIGMFPIVKDIYNYFANGYEFSNFAIDTFNTVAESTQELFTLATSAINGKVVDKTDIASTLRDSIYSIGLLTGIPVRNIQNTVVGLVKRFDEGTAYKYNTLFYNASYTSDIKKALEDGDYDLAETIMDLLLKEEKAGGLSKNATSVITKLYEQGYSVLPKSVSETMTVDEETITLTSKEYSKFKEVYSEALDVVEDVISSSGFASLSESAQAKAIKQVYDAYYEKAKAEVLGSETDNKILALSKWFDTAQISIIFAGLNEITSETDSSGNTISGSKKKNIIAYLLKQDLSDGERLFLICFQGYTISDGDYKNMSQQKAQKVLLKWMLGLKNTTASEKAELATICGFEVSGNTIKA